MDSETDDPRISPLAATGWSSFLRVLRSFGFFCVYGGQFLGLMDSVRGTTVLRLVDLNTPRIEVRLPAWSRF